MRYFAGFCLKKIVWFFPKWSRRCEDAKTELVASMSGLLCVTSIICSERDIAASIFFILALAFSIMPHLTPNVSIGQEGSLCFPPFLRCHQCNIAVLG